MKFKPLVLSEESSYSNGLTMKMVLKFLKHPTIRVILSQACSYSWPLRQLDVRNAFLHGDLQEVVYMKQPSGFVDPTRPTHLCKLHKALYGRLKQAPRAAWFTRISSVLQEIGFTPNKSDTSLFIRRTGKGCIYLLIYVDDIIVTGSDSSGISEIIEYLSKRFDLKDLGALTFFLGLEVLIVHSCYSN